MRVLIDLTQVPVGRMGVGSYAENLLRQFSETALDISLTVALQSDDPALRAVIPARARVLQFPARLFRLLPARLFLEQVVLPFFIRRYRIDLVHSLHYSMPLLRPLLPRRTQRVVTMHDMTAYLLPHMHPWFKGEYMRIFIRQAVRRAEFMIFVSASALGECRKWFGVPIENAAVVHHGMSADFRPDAPPEQAAAVRTRYGLPPEYLLYLGTLEPRKNIPLLLRAFAELMTRHPEARLVVAGKKGWHFDEIFETVAALGLKERVHFTGYVDEADKPALIRGALLFVYPSLHEGFGVPVLEAMASGVPTIAGNQTSIPEIAGDGALLFDPASQQQLSQAMETLYKDGAARTQLAARGIAQAAKFSWKKTAGETAAVYRNMGHESRT